jgi:hypothetical protein
MLDDAFSRLGTEVTGLRRASALRNEQRIGNGGVTRSRIAITKRRFRNSSRSAAFSALGPTFSAGDS